MFPIGKVAGSAAIIKDNKILLLKRSSKSKNFPEKWTFPAGGIDEADNSLEACVIREVKEETNLEFTVTDKFNFYDGIVNNKRYVTLVHIGETQGDLKIDFESESAQYFTYQETLSLDMAFSYRQVLDDLHQQELL